MLKVKSNGIEYNNKFYNMSQNDINWVLEENKKNPTRHPARNLRNMCSTYYEID